MIMQRQRQRQQAKIAPIASGIRAAPWCPKVLWITVMSCWILLVILGLWQGTDASSDECADRSRISISMSWPQCVLAQQWTFIALLWLDIFVSCGCIPSRGRRTRILLVLLFLLGLLLWFAWFVIGSILFFAQIVPSCPMDNAGKQFGFVWFSLYATTWLCAILLLYWFRPHRYVNDGEATGTITTQTRVVQP